jgi:predicted membrane protein
MKESDFVESHIKLDQLSKNKRRFVSLAGLFFIIGLLLFWGGYLFGAYVVLIAAVCVIIFILIIVIKAKK